MAFLLAFSAVFLAATCLLAQVTTATLVGTVKDQSGAAVSGAQVTATNVDSGLSRTVPANKEGEYRIEFLPVGNYTVEVTATGFKKFNQKGVVLTITEVGRADAALEPGNVTETVTVTAAAPDVNTNSAEIGRTVENTEVVNLPIVGRNVYQLLALTPGVQSSTFADNVIGVQQQITMINGGVDGGAGSVAYYLDGGLNMTGVRNTGNALPSPDAVQEFRVDTNNYSAEFGRSDGGIVNVITKSGTNEFHGSVFEFVRNTILNANTYLNSAARPPFHRNQYGGTVGGPVRKNKIFFFSSYDGLRQITPNFISGIIVPTLGERTGNFSADTGFTLKDPIPGGPAFTGNVIPAGSSVFDPTAMFIINNFIPKPNMTNPATGVMDEWQGFASPSPLNFDEGLAKVDVVLTSRQTIEASYFINQGINSVVAGQAATTSLPWSTANYNWRQQNINLGHTWTISPDKVNQMWLSYSRQFGGRTDTPATSLCALSMEALGLPPASSCASQNLYTIEGTPDLPNISVSGFFSLNDAIAGPATGTNLINYRDVFSYTRGRHSFEFGGEISHDNDKQQTLLDNWGSFTFAGKFSGNNLADFELGLQSTQEQDAPVTPYTNSFYYALFAQDAFRVTPRFTVNLGLRWEVQTPPTSANNLESTFIPGRQSTVNPAAPAGLVFPGDAGVGDGIIDTRYHHFEPRVGLAWDPIGDGKTAIRAAAGVYYGIVSGNEWNTTSNFEPFAIRLTSWPNLFAAGKTTFATLTKPYTGFPGGDPFPYTGAFVAGGSIFGVAPNFQWPYSYQLNTSIQRQIGKSLTVSVAYVGTLSHDLPFAVDLNYPTILCGVPAVAGCGTTFINKRRPIDNPDPGTAAASTTSPFGQVFQVESNQHASYNALQVTVVERLAPHFTLNAFYTWSKTIDSVELQNNTTNPTGAGQVPQNYLNLAAERAPADFDVRHYFVGSFVWELDYYHGESRAWKAILNGWSISPIITFHTGLPYTITTGTDVNQDGSSANDRPNVFPGVPIKIPHPSRTAELQAWFNTSAFFKNSITAADPTGNGDAGRNFLYGPGFQDMDLALFRNFHIYERVSLQARLEALNTFNFVNLNNPVTTMTAANFGSITGAGTMRELQIGLRLTF